MPKYETIQFEMKVQGEQEEQNVFTEVLQGIREKLQKTGSVLTRTLSDMKKGATATLSTVSKLFKSMSTGQDTKTANKTLRRTVASFDELNRLVKQATSSTGKNSAAKDNAQVVASAAQVLDKLKELGGKVKEQIIDPLKQLPELGLEQGLQNLGNGILNLMGVFRDHNGLLHTVGGEWGNLNLKTGFWRDTIERANQSTGVFNDMLVQTGFRADTTGQVLNLLGVEVSGTANTFGQLGSSASAGWTAVNQAWSGAASWFSSAVTGPLGTAFGNVFGTIKTDSKNTSTEVKNTFSGLGTNFTTEFSNAWKRVSGAFTSGGSVYTAVEGGVLTGFKTAVNSLISGVNTVTAVPFNGLNTVLDKVQNIKIGSLKPFSFLSWRASVPRIPFLAQGAVLPANKPFLAMVGDQRHGTNVEAPLSTIQEAVVLAMEDYMQGNLAGHAATVELLQQLLSAVQGISIGDETIAAACHRHNSKMAIVNGR